MKLLIGRTLILWGFAALRISAQSSDVTGWQGARWGTSKADFRKALGCDPTAIELIPCANKIWLWDCAPVPLSSNPQQRRREQASIGTSKKLTDYYKCDSDTDMFRIKNHAINDIYYTVDVVFSKGFGLAGVILDYRDHDRSANAIALAELKDRYGDPTPSPKNGYIDWKWVKPHGNLTLSVYRDGSFNIFYSAKSDKNRL